MKKKSCELCTAQARMHCESDQASLCWDCDEKVHAANFLVAKHNRTVLCHVCQSPTPWKASGPKLGRTVSICHACVSRSKIWKNGEASTSAADESEAVGVKHVPAVQSVVADDDDDDSEDHDEVDNDDYDGEEEDDDDDDSVYSDDESDEEEDDNQVVPWTTLPPTTAASCSDDYEMEGTSSNFKDTCNYHYPGGGDRDLSAIKCMRPIAFIYSSDEIARTAPTAKVNEESAAPIEVDEEDFRIFRPFKYRRLLNNERQQPQVDKPWHLMKQVNE